MLVSKYNLWAEVELSQPEAFFLLRRSLPMSLGSKKALYVLFQFNIFKYKQYKK